VDEKTEWPHRTDKKSNAKNINPKNIQKNKKSQCSNALFRWLENLKEEVETPFLPTDQPTGHLISIDEDT